MNPHKKSQRDKLRELIIELVKEKKVKELEKLLRLLEELGFQIKRGKHIAIKNNEMSRFVRLGSLGDGFVEGDFDKMSNEKCLEKRKEMISHYKNRRSRSTNFSWF